MLVCYLIYCIVLHFNTPLERWAHTLKLPIKLPSKEEQSALVTYKNLPDTSYTKGQAVTSLTTDPAAAVAPLPPTDPSMDPSYTGYQDTNTSWDPNAAWGEPAAPVAAAPVQSTGWDTGYNSQPTSGWGDTTSATSGWNNGDGQKNYGYNSTGDVEAPSSTQGTSDIKSPSTQLATQSNSRQQNPEVYKSKEIKQAEIVNPLDKPIDGGLPAQISWAIVYPIHYMCRLTMPDCRTDKYKNWYPFTFLISMIWISFYSYFMVWMITIIGATLGIPDTVMGLTFVAAGVSVPDALSSIAVIKEGYGDMAVSNAVGSNVFDILICLGLPWFIQTAIIKPGSHVNVISKGLAYSTLSLLSTVLFLLVATHMNGWKLDKRLGIILMFWYVLFITVASLYELNVFGELNPPECTSKLKFEVIFYRN